MREQVERSRASGFATPGPAVAVAIGTLRLYKSCISPLLPSACRFHPTCSEYAIEAVRKNGAARGLWMATLRLARCHPFHSGGYDPVR